MCNNFPQSRMVFDVLAGTVIGVVPDIGIDVYACLDPVMWVATMTDLASTSPSTKEALLFG